MKKLLNYTLLFFLLILHLGAESRRPDATVMIPMRDGKELSTDLYLPDPEGRSLPCLLVRSPAGRAADPALANLHFLEHGYMVAIQETRSAIDPEGKTMPFIDDGWLERQDGYDTVEWLSKNSLTNGSIGTVGTSALGITQLMLAPTQPSGLKAQYIQFAAGSIFHHASYPQGQFLKHQIESWLCYYAKDPCHMDKIKKDNRYNDFWTGLNSLARADKVKVPAIFVAGWFDTFLQGALDSFKARQEKGLEGAAGKQKLVVGPWSHFWPRTQKIGEFDVPEEARKIPASLDPVRWFNYYLKGIASAIEEIPAVTYYVMGPFDGTPSKGNCWKTAATWPVPSQEKSLYLTHDNQLSVNKSPNSKVFTFVYDPENPTPTIGGKNLFLDSGPKDQRTLEQRADTLIFTSQVLEEDLEVTGQMRAKLFFSTDCEDTDLVVRLTDVYPDGKSILISDANVRIGSLLGDGVSACSNEIKKPKEVVLDLQAMSLVFAKGHKIRLAITSSNYPRYEKNRNGFLDTTGNPPSCSKVATNSIWIGLDNTSQLILPVVK